MTKVELKQGTNEWLEFRKNHVTATDIAPIMGVCPWEETAYTLFFNKTSKEVPTPKESKYLEWGTRLEPILIDKVVEELNIKYVERGNCYEDRWKMASLDGEGIIELDDGNTEHIIIEAKTTSHKDGWFNEDGSESIPMHYQLQAMWQMIVTGYRKVIFTVFCGATTDWWYRTMEYDEAMADDILADASRFIAMVGKEEPPTPIEQKYASAAEAERKLRQQHTEEKNTSEEVNFNVVNNFIEAKRMSDDASTRLANATNALLEELHGARVALVNGEEAIRLVKSGRGFKYVIK